VFGAKQAKQFIPRGEESEVFILLEQHNSTTNIVNETKHQQPWKVKRKEERIIQEEGR
jgi:hypothetical protein